MTLSVVSPEKQWFAIEVKSSSQWHERDLVGIKAYLNSTKKCRAAILAYRGKDVLKLEDRMWIVPIQLLLR